MGNLILPRRSFLTGLAAAFAAPAIVKASSLMPIRGIPLAPTSLVFDIPISNHGLEAGDIIEFIIDFGEPAETEFYASVVDGPLLTITGLDGGPHTARVRHNGGMWSAKIPLVASLGQ